MKRAKIRYEIVSPTGGRTKRNTLDAAEAHAFEVALDRQLGGRGRGAILILDTWRRRREVSRVRLGVGLLGWTSVPNVDLEVWP